VLALCHAAVYAAVFNNESKFDAHLNLEENIYTSSGAHAGEDGNRP
jgi:hypothetical protein